MNELEEYGRALPERVPIGERPGFRADLRARLLTHVVPAAQARRRQGLGLRWLRPLAATIAALALLAGTAGTVAGASLPGEPGFALKRAAEELLLALAPDDATRAERLVAQSDARLTELRRAPSGSAVAAAATAEYAGAVERLVALVERVRGGPADARRESARALAEAAARAHIAVLESVGTTVPPKAQDALRRAIEAGRRIGVPTKRPGEPEGAPPEPIRAPGTSSPTAAPTRPGPTERPTPGRTQPAGVPTGPPAGTRGTPPTPSRP